MKKLLSAAALLVFAQGCSSLYVSQDQYDRDVNALKQANEQLERRNRDLESKYGGAEWDRVAAERYKELTEELKKLIVETPGVTKIPGGVSMGDILFDLGRAELKPNGKKFLKDLAKQVKSAGAKVTIIGHTDDNAIREVEKRYHVKTNLELGMLRAQNVMRELFDGGVLETKMFLESRGQNDPRVPNNSKANKTQNRRVDIIFE